MIGPKKSATSHVHKKKARQKAGTAATSWSPFQTLFASKLSLNSHVRIKRPLRDSGISNGSRGVVVLVVLVVV